MTRRFFVLFFLFATAATHAQEQISLEQVVTMALEKNYDVRAARNANESASLDRDYVYGAFLPQVNITGATVWNTNDQELRFLDETRNNSGTARSNNTSASILAQWTLFDGTRMFATRKRVIATEEQSELQVKNQMVNTIATVIQNYYDIVRQKQQLKAIREQMAVSEVRVKLAERKFEVGTGAKPELLQARVDYNAQRTQALQQEALIKQLKEQMNSLVDLQLPSTYEVADTIIINLGLEAEDIQENIEYTNYSLQAARRGLAVADLAVREQKAQGLPMLNFNAAYNYSRLENTVLINPFGPAFSLGNGYNYGFTLNIPILNNFNNRRLTQQARIFETRQQLLFDQQRVNVNVSVRNAFTNYDNARKILLIEEENILLARENVNIALEVFRRGASTFVELRTAQQSLADAYTSLISARYLAKVAETELLRLNGSLLK